MRPNIRRTPRGGIALPLVLIVLVTVSMFAALLLDATLQEVRTAAGRTAAMRAQAAVETVLAAMLGATVDSGWVQHPVPLGGSEVTSLFRVSAQARSREGQARARGGAVTFFRLEADTVAAASGQGRLRPISGWWWSPLP
ncbi:MAG: hypothetical protein NTZ43_03430 [Gemmatimonadetes bacterium]|nr:hypothetical protein [Gemmatimonadota bacterium]